MILHIKLLPKCWLKAMCRNVLFIPFPCAHISLQFGTMEEGTEVLAYIIPLTPCLSRIFSPTWGVLQMLHHSKVQSSLQEIVLLQGSSPWEYTVHSKHLIVVTVPVLWKDSEGSCLIPDSKTFQELKRALCARALKWELSLTGCCGHGKLQELSPGLWASVSATHPQILHTQSP